MNKAALREIVQRHVKEGFAERIEIVEQSLCELVEDTPRQQLLRLIEHMTDEALACHQKEERRWAYLTDCDRLDRAFAAMEQAGIVARQHFSCCNNCGHKEITLEARRKAHQAQVGKNEIDIRGYAFYHRGDTERAAKSGILYITFGAIDPQTLIINGKASGKVASKRSTLDDNGHNASRLEGARIGLADKSPEAPGGSSADDTSTSSGLGPGSGAPGLSVAQGSESTFSLPRNSEEVGKIVEKALMDQGLEVIWNGTFMHRICVNGLNWQRRRLSGNPPLRLTVSNQERREVS